MAYRVARRVLPRWGRRRPRFPLATQLWASMMSVAFLTWLEEQSKIDITSPDELRAKLRNIENEASRHRPIVAVIETPSGAVLTLVLGHDQSMLDVFPEDYDGLGSMHCIDPTVRDDDERTLEFFYFTHHSEVPRKHTVPKETALQCAEDFVTTGGAPERVCWEDD